MMSIPVVLMSISGPPVDQVVEEPK